MPSFASIAALAQRPQVLAIVTQLAGASFAFASFVLLARTLAPADFGAWVLFLTAATFLDMVRHGLVQSALVQRSAGSTASQERMLMGGAWVLGLGTTSVLALGVFALGQLLPDAGAFRLFFDWYPLLALAALPHLVATWNGLAREHFGRLLVLKVVLAGGFAVFVVGNFVAPYLSWSQADLSGIARAYLGIHAAGSALMLALGWTRLATLRHATRRAVRTLYRFGRYSVGTTLGSNLLRSADQFILGLWLGPAAVAFYGVPQKLIEVVEIPLRGLAQTAMPTLSRKARRGDMATFARYLHAWIGGLSLALVPLLVVVFVWAEAACVLLAGEAYRDAGTLLRIFVVYMALLPLDRYLGLALDALGRPALNMIKVAAMVVVNIVGDVVALAAFGSVEAVAAVTIVMTLVGTALGAWFVKRHVPFRLRATARAGPEGLRLLLRRTTRGGDALEENPPAIPPSVRSRATLSPGAELAAEGAPSRPAAKPSVLSDGAPTSTAEDAGPRSVQAAAPPMVSADPGRR
ncbi:MAG: lipopolysaccharide biosynthesis protein [Bacteroidota bacterium]